MPRKPIFLIPGFMSTQLAIASNGLHLWWNPDGIVDQGIGKLRLAPNGVDPGPPDGVPMGLEAANNAYPWNAVQLGLQFQLDQSQWQLGYLAWDWRKDPRPLAVALANNIRSVSTPDLPSTLVGHSAGGLLAVLAWAQLVGSGQQNLVRRIITLGTPFQGSYGTIDFLAGSAPSANQIFDLAQIGRAAETGVIAQLNTRFANALALTWPGFYYLFPSLGGTEAAKDPHRALLYNAGNYRAPTAPSQAWLDDARNGFQPAIAAANTFPPDYVATYVAGTSLKTWEALGNGTVPIDWDTRINDNAGDGVVTVGSAMRSPGKQWMTVCDHASLPVGLTYNGELAEMIKDPRGPIDPPPPVTFSKAVVTINSTDAPQQDQVTGLQCIGGHC